MRRNIWIHPLFDQFRYLYLWCGYMHKGHTAFSSDVTLCFCHTPPTSFVCYNSSINTEVFNVLNTSLSEGGRVHHDRTGPRMLHWKMPAVSGWIWTPYTWKIHHQFLPTNHMHYQNKVMKLPSQIPPSFTLRVQRNQI